MISIGIYAVLSQRYFYLPNIKDLSAEIEIIASVLSSDDACWRIVLPHFSHLWVIMKVSPDFSTATGFIIPPHVDARSPGVLSTCFEYKHCGQWFVYPLPVTVAPQCAQVKFSMRFVKRFITVPMRCGTSVLIHLFPSIHLDPVCANVSSV